MGIAIVHRFGDTNNESYFFVAIRMFLKGCLKHFSDSLVFIKNCGGFKVKIEIEKLRDKAAESAYFQWVDKYKDEYLQLRKSYTFYSERDFFLSVKSSMVKEWEQEKEKTRKHQLEKSNAIKKKYDL